MTIYAQHVEALTDIAHAAETFIAARAQLSAAMDKVQEAPYYQVREEMGGEYTLRALFGCSDMIEKINSTECDHLAGLIRVLRATLNPTPKHEEL